MKYKYDDRIFGSQIRCGDSFRTQLNNNVLVIGNSGAGKTRSYVEPNIEAAQEESLIVVDTKNDLHRKFREKLEKKGYKVYSMDLIDLCHSEYGFNPLDMIRKEKDGEYFDVDVMKFASMLVPYDMNRRNIDPFWDLSGQVFASAAIAAMLENSDEKSMRTLFEYINSIDTKEFEEIIEYLKHEGRYKEQSYAVKCFQQVQATKTSDKTFASIISVMRNAFAVMQSREVVAFFDNPNRLDFTVIGKTKCALFINVSDCDRSKDQILSFLFNNLFISLIEYADSKTERRLPVPVNIFFDDFACGSGSSILYFDNLISVFRSRGIAINMMIQNLEQLKKLFPDAETTIISNCDRIFFLGTNDHNTANFISERANKLKSSVLLLPRDKAMLIEAGKPYEIVDKYSSSKNNTTRKQLKLKEKTMNIEMEEAI